MTTTRLNSYLGCLHHSMQSPASPWPFCISVDGMFSACTALVQPVQMPGRISTFGCFASKDKPWAKLTAQGSAPCKGNPRPAKSCWQMLLISIPWGSRDCKSATPGKVVILPCISLKKQHDMRQGVQSAAFDVLQQLGNENKRSACMGKLGQ